LKESDQCTAPIAERRTPTPIDTALSSEAVNVTNHPANDPYPTWSPYGTQIAFSSNRDGNEEIYVMNADGIGLRRLTNDPLPDDVPAWQP
jgi:Tol biopolymer transport system component